jgi:hypothetical protein
MDDEQKGDSNSRQHESFLTTIRSLVVIAYSSPLFIFFTILAIGFVDINACRATRGDDLLQTILGCYFVGGLNLHGH